MWTLRKESQGDFGANVGCYYGVCFDKSEIDAMGCNDNELTRADFTGSWRCELIHTSQCSSKPRTAGLVCISSSSHFPQSSGATSRQSLYSITYL